MPRQNRITPTGHLIATPARGTVMGNRGVLHDAQERIQRLYQGKRWIICQLSFKGRQRQVMAPGRYTELFFLDEATALAAGHRPCAECMRSRFNEFRQLWAAANPDLAGGPTPSVTIIDNVLHQERVRWPRHPEKVTYQAKLTDLPLGAFVRLEIGGPSYLVLEDRLLLWSPQGYASSPPWSAEQVVAVLTPHSVVRTLRLGYVPEFHSSAFSH